MFRGLFDGNGHTITGMNISIADLGVSHEGAMYLGLFASVSGTVKNLTISELEESKLYVLYPLYIAKYENELNSLSYNSKEEDILSVEKVLAEMYNSLNNAELEGIIEHHEYIGLLQSSHQIINYYVKIPEIAEMLVNVMGGVETRTCEQIGEDRKAIEMIKNLMQTTKESFEQVCQLLNVKTEDMVRYKKMI